MAQDNHARKQALIKKFGFDPNDQSWIEKELASNDVEKKWFKFERENGMLWIEPTLQKWEDIVTSYNQTYKDQLDVEIAKNLSKKRMRYMLGAYMTRARGNPTIRDWKQAATDFEKSEREREGRMILWSTSRNGKFPITRTKKSVPFIYGPYFNQCLETVPHVFTDIGCRELKSGVMLRVVSYDPEEKWIRLDFLPDVRKQIKGENDLNENKPWIKDYADYEIRVFPEQIESHLELLENL